MPCFGLKPTHVVTPKISMRLRQCTAILALAIDSSVSAQNQVSLDILLAFSSYLVTLALIGRSLLCVQSHAQLLVAGTHNRLTATAEGQPRRGVGSGL